MVEHTEIDGGGRALQSAQRIEVGFGLHHRQQHFQPGGRSFEQLGIDPHGMVAAGALNAPPRVVQFAENHHPRNAAGLRRVIRNTVLHPAEQHVAAAFAAAAREKTAARRTEREADVPFCTGAHKRRRSAGIAEAENAGKRVQGKTRGHLSVAIYHNVFTVKRQIGVLRGDEQRVQQFFHSSIAPFT